MDKKRQKAIRDFIRSVYLMPETMHCYIPALELRASAEGKKIKSGQDRETAEKEIDSDAFIDSLNVEISSLSIEELKSLTVFHKSKVMQKLRKAKEIISFGTNLQDAIYKKLTE